MRVKKNAIRALVVVGVITAIGCFSFNYVMHGGARDLKTEAVNFTVTSKGISSEFTSNIQISNQKYLEKAVAISGKITSVNGKELVLDGTVICDLTKADLMVYKNQNVTVKGRVVGYDDLLGELKLDQCLIIKTK